MAKIIPITNGRCSAPAQSSPAAPVTHRQAGTPFDRTIPREHFDAILPPKDYPEGVRFVHPAPPELVRQIECDDAELNRLTFGERLVAFMRRWQFRIFLVCYAIAVASGCYFAFQLGRGVL